MATVTRQNVIQIDDRNGSHYEIFRIYHVNGAVSTIDVQDSILGAAEVPSDALTAQAVTIADTSPTDSVKEITLEQGAATGWYTICARFGGTAGSGSGHGVL
jgi:hypothetical protein